MFRRGRTERVRIDASCDDAVLVAAAKEGDANAFNFVVQRYERSVYGLAYRMMGNAADAEDIAQDTFIRAWQALRSYEDGSLKGWLLRIATNRCYDRLRATSRHPVGTLTNDEDDSEIPVVDDSESSDPVLFTERLDLSEAIQAALDTLPPDQRLAVILFDVMQHTYEEAAVIAGVPPGTIKSRVSRGRERLRQQIMSRPDARELIPSQRRFSKDEVGSAGFPEQ
ncbi:MAG: sigma-70 family RNA polymerase sigma factor [Thermomicrobiales bacterium]|nr:sigma-70 family RNA polymerase sigma factor [Thermomicrobiales bacterium]